MPVRNSTLGLELPIFFQVFMIIRPQMQQYALKSVTAAFAGLCRADATCAAMASAVNCRRSFVNEISYFGLMRGNSSCRDGCAATPNCFRNFATVLERATHPFSDQYKTNKDHMDSLVAQLTSEIRHVYKGGGDKAMARHIARDKLLPRERINVLVDEGSSFLELSPLAGKGLYGAFVMHGWQHTHDRHESMFSCFALPLRHKITSQPRPKFSRASLMGAACSF